MRKKQIPLQMDRPSMVEANYNELMERARIRKKAYNWTNQYIGDKTGLAETTVGRFFRGENVSMMNVLYIIDCLGLDLRVI